MKDKVKIRMIDKGFCEQAQFFRVIRTAVVRADWSVMTSPIRGFFRAGDIVMTLNDDEGKPRQEFQGKRDRELSVPPPHLISCWLYPPCTYSSWWCRVGDEGTLCTVPLHPSPFRELATVLCCAVLCYTALYPSL